MKAPPRASWGHLPQIFKDRRRRTRRPEDRGALPAVQPYLRASRFQGRRCLRATARPARTGRTVGGLSKRGENPPWGLRRCLWARLRHRGAAPRRAGRLSARSPIPVQESRPGSLSLAGATPLSHPPLAGLAPRGGPPSPADCRGRARVAPSPPPRPAESGGNPRDMGANEGSKPPPPPRRAIAHPRHGITRPLRTD